MEAWKMEGKPALIIIHMQHSIVDDAGKVAFLGQGKAAREAGIIPRQQAMIKAFRAKKLPVIYVNSVSKPDAVLSPYGRFFSRFKSIPANLPGSKDVEVIPELAPLPGEPVLGNFIFSIFSNSNLENVLKQKGANTLVLSGLATEMAILSSVLNGVDLGYNLIVPSDASASANARAHEMIMNNMIPGMALVTTTEDVLAHL